MKSSHVMSDLQRISASNWNSYTLKKKMTNGEKDQNDELESQNP